MDRVELLVAETLAERAADAPTGPITLATPSRDIRRPLQVAAAIAVILVVAAVTVATGSHRRNQPATQHEHLLPTLPPGVRVASFGAVSLQVPSELPTRTALCGGPVSHEVMADDGSLGLCPVVTNHNADLPGIVVWFSGASEKSPYSAIPQAYGELDGEPVTYGYATNFHNLGQGVSAVVHLPHEGIVIGVTAPTRQIVNQIRSTIAVAPTDPLGCAATLATAGQPRRNGSAEPFVPLGATRSVRCEYDSQTGDGLLIGSYLLDQSDTASLTDALNALRPDPCHCPHGGTLISGDDEVLRFNYADGSTAQIAGRTGYNLDSYTDGSREVADFGGSVRQLLAQLTHEL